MESVYITSAVNPQQLPREAEPEVAFVGRSNCGKSTLLNALTGNKGLARVSRRPGSTQMVNFFQFGPRWRLVDLPGFGFATSGPDARTHWFALVKGYFERRSIAWVLFLHDMRRELDDDDFNILRGMPSHNRRILMVLTKADKFSKEAGSRRSKELEMNLAKIGIEVDGMATVSSTKNTGISELRRMLGLG